MSMFSAVRLLCLVCWVGTVLAAPAPASDHAELLQVVEQIRKVSASIGPSKVSANK